MVTFRFKLDQFLIDYTGVNAYIARYDPEQPTHLSEAVCGSYRSLFAYLALSAGACRGVCRGSTLGQPSECAGGCAERGLLGAIQRAYSVNPDLMNLNNGGVSPAPVVVQEAVERYNQLTNEGPSYYMWQILDQGREPLREKLANTGRRKARRDRDQPQLDRSAEHHHLRAAAESRRRSDRDQAGLSQHDPGLPAASRARWHRLQADQLRLSDRRRRR